MCLKPKYSLTILYLAVVFYEFAMTDCNCALWQENRGTLWVWTSQGNGFCSWPMRQTWKKALFSGSPSCASKCQHHFRAAFKSTFLMPFPPSRSLKYMSLLALHECPLLADSLLWVEMERLKPLITCNLQWS